MNLWFDDIRPAPEGWDWAKSFDEAVALLKTGNVENASLDHYMGLGQPTGYDLVMWMEQNQTWPARSIYVHSADPVGRAKMKIVIGRNRSLQMRG